jgi:hypothetical protein
MAEIFLSYAREDRARAEQLAQALNAAGLEVFWDNEIPPGTTWADYIEGKLTQCKALIVLWSDASTKSQWVREEARMGRDKGVLIPVMIDGSQPPFGFGEVQSADLSHWTGNAEDANWQRFVGAVRSLSSSTRPPPPPPPRAPQPLHATPPRMQPAEKRKGVPVWVWVVGAVVATLVLLGIIGSMEEANKPGAPEPQQQAAAQQQQQQPYAAAPQAQPQQQAQIPPDSQQILLGQLQQAEQIAAQQGFQRVGQPFAGGLVQGQSWNVPAQLVAGYEYRVLGVCDQNCRDMDLAVYDESGATVAQDNASDDHPVVAVTPATSGQFTIQAQMFQCTGQPCYYALILYGRAAQ